MVVEGANRSIVIALKDLPFHEIEGTQFYVEVNSQALIERENPANIILFRELRDHGTHYSMCYHPGYKNCPCELDPPEESVDITIPPLIVLAPQGMAKKYGVDVESLANRTDLELLNPNYQGFLERVSGKLPEIDINGERFIVDLQHGELRLIDHPELTLRFKDFEPGFFDDDFSYRFFYDPGQRAVISGEEAARSTKGNILKVELPLTIQLDPVWIARSLGREDKAFIRDYPVQKDLKASVEEIAPGVKPALNADKTIANTRKGLNTKRAKGRKL